jgi:transcriptional regulator with XRE-family HTH domain
MYKNKPGNMLGEKLRALREAKGLVQRQVAAELEVDTAYVSKMENNEKRVSRQHLKKLSGILGISEETLQTLWLADKLYDLAKDEKVGLKAIETAEQELRMHKKLAK